MYKIMNRFEGLWLVIDTNLLIHSLKRELLPRSSFFMEYF